MSLKVKAIISLIVLFLGALGMFNGIAVDRGWLVAVGFFAVLAGAGCHTYWWRCPNCASGLGWSYGEYGPHCGQKINYDAKS